MTMSIIKNGCGAKIICQKWKEHDEISTKNANFEA